MRYSSASRRSTHRLARLTLAALLVAPVPVVLPAAAAQAAPAGCEAATGSPTAPTARTWALTRLAPETVWPLTRGRGVTVAVIDSGVGNTHPLMKGQVLPGRDFGGLSDFDGRCDLVGHGTVVAGIIAARDGTNLPYSGIAPEAKILPVRVLPDAKETQDATLPGRIADAIRWSVDQGAAVINLSLETADNAALRSAVEYAESKDVVLVAASGNKAEDQTKPIVYPAGYETVIAVGGVGEDGKHVSSSVSGNYIDVAGPGLDLVGPAADGDGFIYLPDGGTSFATAYVSGVAALIRAHNDGLTAKQVRNRITLTAERPPTRTDSAVGNGLVNPYRAVTAVFSQRSPAPQGQVVLTGSPEDPLATAKVVATWAIGIALVLGLALLGGAPLIRRGRRHGWRPDHRGAE